MKLMGHVIADYPTPAAARRMIALMAEAGVATIEIQIPFSEPMADGPVFLAANHKALAQGVGFDASLKLMAEVTRAHPRVDFVFMTYLNIVYQRGYESFAKEASAAGAKGVIIPDLPVEYAEEWEAACEKHKLYNVRMVAPSTPEARLKVTLAGASGFVYVVARAGVTGGKTDISQQLGERLAVIAKHTKTPLAVGFGVQTPADVTALRAAGASHAIVGTAALKAWEQGETTYSQFWRGLASVCL
jgi:tryptophan synthase alpha chain